MAEPHQAHLGKLLSICLDQLPCMTNYCVLHFSTFRILVVFFIFNYSSLPIQLCSIWTKYACTASIYEWCNPSIRPFSCPKRDNPTPDWPKITRRRPCIDSKSRVLKTIRTSILRRPHSTCRTYRKRIFKHIQRSTGRVVFFFNNHSSILLNFFFFLVFPLGRRCRKISWRLRLKTIVLPSRTSNSSRKYKSRPQNKRTRNGRRHYLHVKNHAPSKARFLHGLRGLLSHNPRSLNG